MSGHRPARTRLIATSILVIVAALATFVAMITVRYRDGLENSAVDTGGERDIRLTHVAPPNRFGP